MTGYIQKIYGANFDIKPVKNLFLNNKNSFSHNRHISAEACRQVGINVLDLEDSPELQDAVLSLHHTYMILLDRSNISKIVENQDAKCYIQQFDPKKMIPA